MVLPGDPKIPVELLPVDISAYRDGNTGIPYVTTFDSGVPGPHVAINALTHGNEVCGAHALRFLFEQNVRPAKGKLTLSFANVAAYDRFDADNPTASRFVDEDLNRVWDTEVLDGERHSMELTRAREMRPLIDDVDFLLDIHSMQLPSPPLVLCGTTERGRAVAEAVGIPKFVVADAGHAAGKRMRDYQHFGAADDPRTALLVECGQHWDTESASVAIQTALRFLVFHGAVNQDFAAAHLKPIDARQRFIEVTGPYTIKSPEFRFTRRLIGLEVIEKKGTVIGTDGDDNVRTPYDNCVMIMPTRRMQPGQTAVRFGRFVD